MARLRRAGMRFDPDLPVYRSGNIYPANLQVIQDAHGIIVHSEYSRQLADKSYGPGTADDWAVIPHLRVPMAFNLKKAVLRLAC